MKRPPKRDPIPRFLRQPSNGIVGYEGKSPEEQAKMFAGLIEAQGGKAVRKLWPKLDEWTRFYVMERLGCLAGPGAPQDFFLPQFERGRAVGAEVRRHIATVKKYIEATEQSVRRLGEWNFRSEHHEQLISGSRIVLAGLEELKKTCSSRYSGPSDRDIRSIVEAREFVRGRSSSLGTPVNLNPAAIADILELNGLGQENAPERMEESVRKALRRFRDKPDYQEYMNAMGELIPDCKVPLPSEEVGQTTPEKEVTAVPSFIS